MLGVHDPSNGLAQRIRKPTDVDCCRFCISTASGAAGAVAAATAEVENVCTLVRG